MSKSIFNNKKIIFYGPARTTDKEFIDVNEYDYVIITNNMINIFFDKYNEKLYCKVILLVNKLYALKYTETIKKYINDIYIIFVIEEVYGYLRKNIKKTNIFRIPAVPGVRKVPLCLSRILYLLKNKGFKELYITGVTFYKEKKIEECYEDNYMVEESKKYNIFNKDKHVHDIISNIRYTRRMCDKNNNISMCKELFDILYKKKGKTIII